MGCTKDLVDEAGDRIGRGVVGLEVQTRLMKDQEEERALEGEIFERLAAELETQKACAFWKGGGMKK